MSKAQWYVAHTYSGYENKVKLDIEKTIENRGLQEQILEVCVPMQSVLELKNGVEKLSDKKLFPGYVLVHMVMNDETWYVVRNTRGVTGFVGPGSKPVPLTPGEMASLGFGDAQKDAKQEKLIIDFAVGDSVTVISGAWKDGNSCAGRTIKESGLFQISLRPTDPVFEHSLPTTRKHFCEVFC